MLLLKCCTQYFSKFAKLSRGQRSGKGQFSFQSQRRAMPNNIQTTVQLCSFCMIAQLCSKSFKQGFNSIWTKNFQMYKLGLEKAEESEIKLPPFTGSWRKQGNSTKTSTSASLITVKPLRVCITTNYKKFLKRWEYQTTWPAFWEIYMQVKKQYLELDMEQQSGSKLGKEYIKAVYWHHAYLMSMQITSWEMQGWMTH